MVFVSLFIGLDHIKTRKREDYFSLLLLSINMDEDSYI